MTDETQVEQQQPAPATAEAAPAEQAAAELNISDLMALKTIVEVASQRGAFKANELEGVGKTYNKLSNFLETVAKREAK